MTAAPLLTAMAGWIFFPLAFFAAGRPFAGLAARLAIPQQGVVRSALGMAVTGYALVALGSFGLLRPGPVLILLGLLAASALFSLRDFKAWLGSVFEIPRTAQGVVSRVSVIVLGGILALTLALSLLPEVANDALCYQLFLPRQFVLRGSTLPMPYDLNSYIPLFMNHLYALGLLLRSVPLAKFFHAYSGLLLLAAVMTTVREETGDKGLALKTGLALWLTPTLLNQITTTYIDVAVALFSFLSFYFLWRGSSNARRGDFFLSGLLLGLAVSSKILALLAGVPVAAVFLLRLARRENFPKLAGEAAWMAGGLALGCGFWFARNAVLTGNPVYPYLGSVFGTREFNDVSQFQQMGPPKTLLNYLLLPLNMTLHPIDYDRGHWIGPFYLAALPVFLWGLWKNKSLRLPALYVWAFVSAWFLFFHNARFLFQVLPIYAVGAACGFHLAAQNRGVKFAGGFVYAGLVLFLAALGLYHYRLPLQVLAGRMSAVDYITRVERSYPAAVWANQNLPPGARIFNREEIRMFYFERQSLREHWFDLGTGYASSVSTPEDFAELLKRSGFTHILTTSDLEKPAPDTAAEHRSALMRNLLARPDLVRFLKEIPSENIREAGETYRFYEIL
ncbi:MAG TPA: phospholipid carrier-dependent glycosyltransferase [Verrucomicrobiae bacterium]|jgi:hypothetical protein|nr:phospholipid carrier-dependent glycosyltransferase [Verrucomicrobiae bacterium]